MVETKFVSDTLWKSQGEPAGEFQRKTVLEDEQRVNSKELQTMADGGVIDSVALCGDNMGGSFIYSLVATDGWTGRTGAVPLLAREQSMVVKGLEGRRQTAALYCSGDRLGQLQRACQRHSHRVLR